MPGTLIHLDLREFLGGGRTRAAVQAATVALVCAAVATAVAGAPSAAAAAPSLMPGTQVGASPIDPSVADPIPVDLPPARQRAGACVFDFGSAPSLPTRHVATCGDAATGTGAADRPWRTVRQALAGAVAGDVIYVHDSSAAVDYTESDLTPVRPGSAQARIRLVGAPGEQMPTIAKPSGAALAKPVLRLTQPWWIVDRLQILGTGVERSSAVLATGSNLLLNRLDVTQAGAANAAVTISQGSNVALLNSHIHEAVTGDEVTGRPSRVPTGSSDNHGFTVYDGADRVLIRGNHSYGHNGDSVQCGEAPGAAPTNLTIDGNRFHTEEENAIDIKHCLGVTISANKLFAFYPARPLSTKRSPHGDAIVVHHDGAGEGADRVLIERNRFFRNSRSINLGSQAGVVVVRRNLIFDGRTDHCGIGAGIRAASRLVEIYFNTLHRLPAPATAPGSGCPTWSDSERAAIRINSDGSTQTAVLWNNIVAGVYRHLQITPPSGGLDSATNLFDVVPAGGAPAGSLFGDPEFISDPANNDYYTEAGSPARDHATPVPAAVHDPVTYCPDGDAPDIGFLESCATAAP